MGDDGMGMTGNHKVDEHIERLCSHGCRRVRAEGTEAQRTRRGEY